MLAPYAVTSPLRPGCNHYMIRAVFEDLVFVYLALEEVVDVFQLPDHRQTPVPDSCRLSEAGQTRLECHPPPELTSSLGQRDCVAARSEGGCCFESGGTTTYDQDV